MELLRYQPVEDSFHKLVKKFLTKNEEYNVKNFIGGLPITLERKDVINLILKEKDSYKYNVTQKVDGTRVLMYIGHDNSDKRSSGKSRTVCFVDRNMKIYSITDGKRNVLPYLNTGEMLLDGEIVFFDSEGASHKNLEFQKVKGISFMAFDILFGPETIDLDSDGNKNIGQSVSMIVPEDGKLRTMPWSYINRYDILHKLIIPSKFNKFEPLLTESFKTVNWFNIELKPIYFLSTLKNSKTLYNNIGTGYLQTLLNKSRTDFYKILHDKYSKEMNVFIKKKITLDGLIFTSSDTLYRIGPWNYGLTTQYKWKPTEEQTVEFHVKKISQTRAELNLLKDKQIVPFQLHYNNVLANVPPYVKTGNIAEFKMDKNMNFVFVGLREDKNIPNSLRTILNVINSFKNPVDIDDLYLFLNINNLNKQDLIKVLNYTPKATMIKCIINNTDMKILDDDIKNSLDNMVKSITKDNNLELEIRIGNITNNFNPNLSKDFFVDIMSKLENLKYKKERQDFVDVYSNGIRTRYLYSKEFKKYIQYESIYKNRISNTDLKTNNILGFDMRVSYSSENKISQYNTEGECYRKIRTSFKDLEDNFSLDLTEIIPGNFKNRDFTTDSKIPNVKFGCELEIMSNKIDIEKIIKLLIYMIK